MKFYSIKDKSHQVSFAEAMINGLAPENSLYFPNEIPVFSKHFFSDMQHMTLPELAFHVLKPYVAENLSPADLVEITEQVFDFDIPLVPVQDSVYALELFHGPTLAFKDVGARFLARCMQHLNKNLTARVLVATSGDTGSAVANGFLGIEGTQVVVLYPKGKVSPLQQKQFATLGQNIKPIAVNGTFDDCQRLVKAAFSDSGINKKMNLTSANSINVARWLPQSVYYYWAVAQVADKSKKIVVSVPSGNLGNLTSGILAKKTGLPIDTFIAASNQNDTLPRFLKSGSYNPMHTVQTIANAMDVGDPNNFPRLLELYHSDYKQIKQEVQSFSYPDDTIKSWIKNCYQNNQHLLDPHGATGFASLIESKLSPDQVGLFLETAHPAKFRETVEAVINQNITLPERLAAFDNRTIQTDELDASYDAFKAYLLQLS